jgi:hypothetical protein
MLISFTKKKEPTDIDWHSYIEQNQLQNLHLIQRSFPFSHLKKKEKKRMVVVVVGGGGGGGGALIIENHHKLWGYLHLETQ